VSGPLGGGVGAHTDAATVAVETTMYRALAVLRVVVLANAVAFNVYRWDTMADAGDAWVILVLMTVWTAVAIWAYDQPALRRAPLLLTDLAVTAATLLASPLAMGADLESTVPGFWVMGVVLAWGIRWHWVGGLVASTTVSLADLAIRPELDQTNLGNLFLLMIGGPVLGYTSGLLKEMAAARDRAEREAAVAAERARLARVVHDGVLQVLALVQRRGREIGGDAAELGRLAGEQEVALRALVQGGGSDPAYSFTGQLQAATGTVDLAGELRALSDAHVTVSVPGTPVEIDAADADEIAAAIRACLDNVALHVGPEAPAWVLLEDLGDRLVVTVRDEGPGIPAGRLDEAEAQGRLGVVQSIRGRVADLGGTASVVTAPGQGTEWELTFPK
jgi:signal transduction histidine kinase